MKQKIIEFIEKDLNEISLKEIYKNFSDVSKPKLRSTLNFLVNTGKIIRIKRGFYIKCHQN